MGWHNLKLEISDLKKKGAMKPSSALLGKGRQRLAKTCGQEYDATAFRVAKYLSDINPRVETRPETPHAFQPWADLWNPVGVRIRGNCGLALNFGPRLVSL